MPKLYRRSWERQFYGRNGAVSSPLPARTGTDGAISGASFSAPVVAFTSATASFVSTDVGRKIRLTGTPSNRYNGNYVIDSVNSSTSVNLRCNHNVGGTPTSGAKFYENGTSITWRIHESCTFTADTAGDIQDFYPGSYIYIESGNVENRGLWLISHRTSNQVCTLSKSYVWHVVDFNPYADFNMDAAYSFTVESGLKWYVTDRQALHTLDAYELAVQFLIDAGWSMYQQRGHSNTLKTTRDIVLKSVGEPDAQIPGGKAMFLRAVAGGGWQSAKRFNHVGWDIGLFHHWDPTQTATVPGNGVGGVRAHEFNSNIAAANPTAIFDQSTEPFWTNAYPFRVTGAGRASDFNAIGRLGLQEAIAPHDWTFFGDADEISMSGTHDGAQNTRTRITFGHLKPIGSNPNIVTVINNVTSGTNKDLNTGNVDIAALTPPYQVGDKITIIGRKTASPAEYVETTTIVSFNNTDPNNRLVRVANLNMAYGNGPDTLKLQIGEDPFPVGIQRNVGDTNVSRFHNTTNFGNATGRDYDATNLGINEANTNWFSIWNLGFNEIDPNVKTGRYGIVATGIRLTGTGEVRGRFRYTWLFPDYIVSMGTKMLAPNNTDAFVLAHKAGSGISVVLGPMSKAMAGIWS